MWTIFKLIHFKVPKMFWSKFEQFEIFSDLKKLIFQLDQNGISLIWRKKNLHRSKEVDQNVSSMNSLWNRRYHGKNLFRISKWIKVSVPSFVVSFLYKRFNFKIFEGLDPIATRFDPFLMLFKRKRNSKLDFLNFNLVEIKIFEKLEIFSQRMFGLIHFNHFGIKIDDPGWSIVTGTWSNKVSD